MCSLKDEHIRLHAYGKLYWRLSWDVRDAGTFLKRSRAREEVTRSPCSTVKERSVQPLCLEGARTYRLENWMKWLAWRWRGKWSQCFAMIVVIKGLHQSDSGESWFLTPKTILGLQWEGKRRPPQQPSWGEKIDRGVGFPKSLKGKKKNLKIWWWIAFADDLGSTDWN